MITQEDLEKSDKLAFIHERFKKHVPSTGGRIVLCTSCGMPLDGKEVPSILPNPSISIVHAFIYELERMDFSAKQQHIMFGTWVQHYVPDPQVGRAMQAAMTAGLYQHKEMEEVVALLSPWALYHYLFHLKLARPGNDKIYGQERLRKVFFEKCIETDEYRLPCLMAQFIDKEPREDTERAVANSAYAAVYSNFKTQYNKMKGVCNI
jgi:hypothetical protein